MGRCACPVVPELRNGHDEMYTLEVLIVIRSIGATKYLEPLRCIPNKCIVPARHY